MKKQFYSKKNLGSLLFMSTIVASSCQPLPDQTSSEKTVENSLENRQPQVVMDLWENHVQDAMSLGELQRDCVPRHFTPDDQKPSQGIVVLIHGLTACPQQFFNIGNRLAQEGFDVFLPLLPGNGLIPSEALGRDGYPKDRLDQLPTGKDRERYKFFVDKMNAIGRAAVGIKVIGGLSGGGGVGVATQVEGTGTWDRGLFFAPFFKSPGAMGPLTAMLNIFQPRQTVHWGDVCSKGRNQPGQRHGYCALTAEALRAMRDFNASYVTLTRSLRQDMMVVGTEDDESTDNRWLIKLHTNALKSHICFYPKGVPHSMLSRVENQETGYYWLDALESDAIRYVKDGIPFTTDEDALSTEYKKMRCRVKI
jgi:hypothetical protein